MAKKRMTKILPVTNMTWQEAHQQFMAFKKAQGTAERTLADYDYYIKYFFTKYCPALDSLTLKQDTQTFLGEKIAPATFNRRLHALGPFYRWCVDEGVMNLNPFSGFRTRRVDSRIVNIDPELLTKLLSLPDKKTFAGLRDFGAMLLTLDCGIRPKEVFTLTADDFNLGPNPEVTIRAANAKTRTARHLPLSPVTAKTIQEVIRAKPAEWDKLPVLCTYEGTVMTHGTWADRIRGYGAKLGIKLRPYDLRHSFALNFLRNGGNVFALQRMMGHTDLSMTKRYIALTSQDLKDQHDKASPLTTLLTEKKRKRTI